MVKNIKCKYRPSIVKGLTTAYTINCPEKILQHFKNVLSNSSKRDTQSELCTVCMLFFLSDYNDIVDFELCIHLTFLSTQDQP